MELGKVVGSVWATKKNESLNGLKLMIIKSIDEKEDESNRVTVAADIVGAGVGDTVLVVRGGSARFAIQSCDTPIDAAIVGIVDSIEVECKR
ncbi:EutN/CcmL family microcompartment protein [Anaerosporobacter faecicola]|uniref:EutN/CcmL family microcompartment protein n=1 Tax=Anaerosporobacter faecicola TaxID=2718714 RepID=UPI00143BF079|nr:EutN/CcmL family microcompartment protein [Anaerosporobacter faecicola]